MALGHDIGAMSRDHVGIAPPHLYFRGSLFVCVSRMQCVCLFISRTYGNEKKKNDNHSYITIIITREAFLHENHSHEALSPETISRGVLIPSNPC